MTELDDAISARIALAYELRRGMHLLVGRDPSAAELTEFTAQLRVVFDQLDAASSRQRAASSAFSTASTSDFPNLLVPADGETFAESLDRPVSGPGNPFSVPMTMRRDGDTVVSTVNLDNGFEGAPGRSHGGIVAAIFDDLFGSVPMLHGKIAFTASLNIEYVAPSPVREPVTYRGWVDRIEGKKIFVVGESHHHDVLVTRAQGLFIDATEHFAALYDG